MKMNAAIAAAILAFTSSVSAHMVLSNPIPFTGGDQAPLGETGADFPCGKDMANGYTVGTMNTWTAGSTQEVSFLGTAVHSGGSCQFAFSTDPKPTKSSQWKVIHSVVGGCPMNMPDGVAANADTFLGIPASASWPVPDKVKVTVPKDTPNGQLTFAWIWFNKTGNREMYMKCAPVEITGGAGNANALNKLPKIRKANIGNGCTTVEGKDVNFQTGDGFVGNCGVGGGSPPPPPANNNKPPPSNSNNNTPPPPPPSTGGGGSCAGKPDGFACLSETKWATCVGGKGVAMDVAPGTKCRGGAFVAAKVRRRNGGSVVRSRVARARAFQA